MFLLIAHLCIPRFLSSKPEAVVEQNVNLTDVEHHSKFSDGWWDINGPMKGEKWRTVSL